MSIKLEGKKFSDFVSGMSEASSPASDDYVALDGATNGTRKLLSSKLAKTSDVTEAVFNESVARDTAINTACGGLKTALEAEIATKLDDAPSDGKQYARKDGEWAEVETGTTEKDVTSSVSFTDGKAVKYSDGTLINSASQAYSNQVACAGYAYVVLKMSVMSAISYEGGLVFFDENGSYISGVNTRHGATENGTEEKTVEIPENASYFITSYWNSTNRALYGEFSCSLKPQIYKVIENETAERKAADTELKNEISSVKIIEKDISSSVVLTDGTFINYASGEVKTNTSTSSSDFIACESYAEITLTVNQTTNTNPDVGLAFYDESKTYLSGIQCEKGASERGMVEKSYEIPEGAYYFRTTSWNASIREELGVEFKCVLNNKLVYSVDKLQQNVDDIEQDVEEVKTGITDYITQNLPFGSPSPYLPEAEEDEVLDSKTSSELYAIVDSCLNDVFARKDDIGTDADGNAIRYYQLRTNIILNYSEGALTPNYWLSSQDPKHILLISGVHGDEKSSSIGAAKFIKELVESNDEWAMYLKSNFIIDYVPIVNVWGFENTSRMNKDGININRDFVNFATTEAQAVKGLADTLGDSLAVFIDAHGTSGSTGYIAARSDSKFYNLQCNIAYRIVSMCRNKFYEIYGSSALSPYLHIDDHTKTADFDATALAWTCRNGIAGAILETPRILSGGSVNHNNCTPIAKMLIGNTMQMLGQAVVK